MINKYTHLNEDIVEQYENIYIVTDLHGRFDLLKLLIKELDITNQDMLLSLGDNIDRGNESFELLYFFLYSENAISLEGNHERTFINAVLNPTASNMAELIGNEGSWVDNYPSSMIRAIADRAKEMPCLLTFDWKNKLIALSHAHIPELDLNLTIKNINDSATQESLTGFFSPLVPRGNVEGADLVIHGHRYVAKPTMVGNRLYVDTGASYLRSGSERNILSVVHFARSKAYLYTFSMSDEKLLEWESEQILEL